jgi:hypothetical protein
MSIEIAVFRRRSGAVNFASTFQTIGTENLGSKVGVGGTGYLLGVGYIHSYSDHWTVSGGFAHLSSHLTRDLDDKLDEQRSKGVSIPVVLDPSQYNVVYVSFFRRAPNWPLAPELKMIATPVTFRFGGGDAGYVRPIFLATRVTIWRGGRKAFLAETEHEIGKNPFNTFLLSLALFADARQDERFHLFASATPGRNFHVSPTVGGRRDGIAFGIRMRFRA